MITDIYKPIDSDSQSSLNRIQDLLDSNFFLAGLGRNSPDYPISNKPSVITDFERCIYLMSSQLMHDNYDEDGEQYFPEVLKSATWMTGMDQYDHEQARRRKKLMESDEQMDRLDEYLRSVIQDAYNQHGVREFLATNLANVKNHNLDLYLDNLFPDAMYTCFDGFVRAAYFGGLQTWPVSNHLFECYMIGGLPTGWIGKVPLKGGIAENCLQIIHFGPKEQLLQEILFVLINTRTLYLIVTTCIFGTVATMANAEFASERPMYVQKYDLRCLSL